MTNDPRFITRECGWGCKKARSVHALMSLLSPADRVRVVPSCPPALWFCLVRSWELDKVCPAFWTDSLRSGDVVPTCYRPITLSSPWKGRDRKLRWHVWLQTRYGKAREGSRRGLEHTYPKILLYFSSISTQSLSHICTVRDIKTGNMKSFPKETVLK